MRWHVVAALAGIVAGCGDPATSLPVTRFGAAEASVATAPPRARPRVHSQPALDESGEMEWPPDSREPADPPPPPSPTSVRGRVVDATGAPIPHAHVAAFSGTWKDDGWTDDDGAFDVAVTGSTGIVRCLAWAEDHAVAIGPWLALEEDEHADAGTLRCGVAARIEGCIVKEDGTSTYGAVSFDTTDAYDPETWAIVRKCTEIGRLDVPYLCSRGGERFSVSWLAPGTYWLHADDLGERVCVTAPSADVRLRIDSAMEAAEREKSRRPADDASPHRDSGLPHRSIRGIVTSADRPITWTTDAEGALATGSRFLIRAVRADDGSVCGSTTTATDGSFDLADLDAGAIRLWASADGTSFLPTRISVSVGDENVRLEMQSPRSRRFRLVLPEGFGRVDDEEGSITYAEDEVADPDWEVRDGCIVVTNLTAGATYSLAARFRCGKVWSAPAHVTFTAGDETLDLPIDAGSRITGSLVRPDGSPIVGGYVYFRNVLGDDAEEYTGLDGTFVLTGIVPGRWTVEASAKGFDEVETETYLGPAGSLRIEMTLAR